MNRRLRFFHKSFHKLCFNGWVGNGIGLDHNRTDEEPGEGLESLNNAPNDLMKPNEI
jgi:hypothetical protein